MSGSRVTRRWALQAVACAVAAAAAASPRVHQGPLVARERGGAGAEPAPSARRPRPSLPPSPTDRNDLEVQESHSNVVPSPGLRSCLLHTCLRPGKVRNPPEVRSSGGRGGSSGDGETGTSPPRPQLPCDAAEPPEKVCKLPAGAARTPGHLGGGRAGALGASSLPGPKPAAATFCRAAHRRWWARAPGPEGASPSEGTCLSLQAWKARQWRGSPRLHSCSRLLPLSCSRWHRYLFPAAAPNDSSRLRRGCSSQSTAAEPSSPPDSPRNSSKLFTTFLEGQDSRRNQGDVFSRRLHPAFPLP
ncbi:hypothetical protein CapIbe_003810 [Capra ibex]